MATKLGKGRWLIKHYPKTASTTFTAMDLVRLSSGYVATATVSTTKHIGFILEAVTSGDSDYTGVGTVAVAVPDDKKCEFIADVTGTLLTTDIGVQFDMSTAGLVNQDGTTSKVVTCVGFIATNRGIFTLNSDQDYADATWE